MKQLKNKEILTIIIVYIFLTINLSIKNIELYQNVINPLFWFCVLNYSLWNIKKYYIRFCKEKRYIIYITIISCLNIIIYFYMGFLFGFLKNPYNNLSSILKNIVIQILPIVSIEITRAIIITGNKNNKLVIVLVTILLVLVEINYSELAQIYLNKEKLFKYICGNVVSLIACNILYTYLVLQFSYSTTLIYRISKKITVLLLPIIPNIDWFIDGTSCILSSVLIYLLFKYKFTKEKKYQIKNKKDRFLKIIYAITIILCITLVCFMAGIFKYEPIVILSNSMAPIFNKGDAIIFKKLNDNELREIPVNTIIIYTIGDQNIAHRIVDVVKENDTIQYKTKGDRNNIEDTNLVQTNQIKGEYIFNIKYIGFPSVWLHEYFNKEEIKVETK